MATPYSLQAFDEVTSTQDLAAAALVDGPVLVVAARQTEGRGRSQRAWESAPRAVAASLAFRPEWDIGSWPLIPLVAGLAAAEALGGHIGLKWPNDLLLGEDKVGGILVEGSAEGLVAGCGLNLWWPEPPAGVVGRWIADPGPSAVIEIGTAWANDFLERLSAGPAKWGRGEYVNLSVTLGRRITWEPGGAGTAVDIDETGALVVETETGTERLVAGEIRHIRSW
jgi:BirA family transcriptional regulator, biotin operon repressor / biotin---[acetyl-CoA-carboxylase] ligase